MRLGLSPSAFAAAAGVTPQGLAPLRRGERKQYQVKLKVGAARALRWSEDSIDRLLRGEEPIELPNGDPVERTLSDRLDLVDEKLELILRRLDVPSGEVVVIGASGRW